MRVLAGDIGGTKTAIAVVQIGARSLSLVHSRKYWSGRFRSLEEILERFLAGERRFPRAAAFGVAGPVRRGRAKLTKLPWTIDQRRISRVTGIPRVEVLNDFVAAALGISYLKPRQTVLLSAGQAERQGPIALIGAGTGLGQAALVRACGKYEILPSEGGHADFGPRNPTEDGLVRFVRRKFGRASSDRLISGEGLTHIYDFLKEERFSRESDSVERAFESEDRPAVISRFALARRDPLCEEALRLFVSLYGSEAGNLALRYRATGGVYVGGGIAVKILPALRGPAFLESFRSKPPMEALLAKIPVRVVREARLPLFGAAAAAYRMAIETTRPSSKTIVRPTRR